MKPRRRRAGCTSVLRLVFPERVAPERHAVAWFLLHLNDAVFTNGNLLEEILRQPVHQLDQEAVRKRGADVRGDLVRDMRRDLQPVRGGEVTDLERLRVAVGAADI